VDAVGVDTYLINSEDRAAQPAAVRTATLAVGELPEWLGQTFARVTGYLKAHSSYPDGPPFARYFKRADGRFEVAAGFPVRTPVEGDGDVQGVTLPGGSTATTMHVGSYDDMEPGYRAITDWIDTQNAEPIGDPWEVYFSDPGTQPNPAHWRTQIVQPYRITGPTR
jgi:effector-binding domain-containing protein